ncbi:hypothetical protein B484DRAFT_456218 [Ochromonadaceae sp. CCMP2298]|nr:hypothetical protein B484DRAFT_456218 [Ochromonadaceae sp. CCMP2298]
MEAAAAAGASDVSKLLGIFDDLTQAGDSLQEGDRPAYYKSTCVDLIRIKGLNRRVYSAMEDRRQQMDSKKQKVDQLQLAYENLLYEKTHLQREIRACKDLPTPNLLEIEAELGRPLSTRVFAELPQVAALSAQVLEQEQAGREEAERLLQGVKDARKGALDRLDRRRKFTEQLPGRVEALHREVGGVLALFEEREREREREAEKDKEEQGGEKVEES